MIQALLDAEANPNVQDHEGKTALHLVLEKKEINADMVHALLDKGANVNIKDKIGYPAFHRAFYNNRLFDDKNKDSARTMLPRLIKKDNVNTKGISGNTVLHIILERHANQIEFIQHIINVGANTNMKNDLNKTPLDLVWLNDRLKKKLENMFSKKLS